MQKILITGASGRIGGGLVSSLECLVNQEDYVSLLEHNALSPIPRAKVKFNIIDKLDGEYDLCIHLAAITDTAYCQKNPEEAREVNVGLTKEVCDFSQRVILISTDYVFNGNLSQGEFYKETDPVNPFNVYGETKAESEKIVLGKSGTVLRIETMMGVPNKIVDAARAAISGKDPKYYPPYTNFSIRPANFNDLLSVLSKTIPESHPGIYHVSCSGDALSRAEMAQLVLEVYKEKGWGRGIDEFKTEQYKETKRFALGTDKARQEFGISFTDSRKAIRSHVLSGL